MKKKEDTSVRLDLLKVLPRGLDRPATVRELAKSSGHSGKTIERTLQRLREELPDEIFWTSGGWKILEKRFRPQR